MTNRPHLILFALLLLALPARADSFHYACTQVSLDAGLSSPTVLDILEDDSGTLWIGTKEGLDVFYASGRKSYRLGGSISSIKQDYDGHIWVSTEESVFRYDPESDSFEALAPGAGGWLFPYGQEMWAYKDNMLWRILLSDASVSSVRFPSNIYIGDILSDGDDGVILGSMFSGLWRYDTINGEVVRFSSEEIYSLGSLLRVGDDIYAGSRRDGVFVFGPDGRMKGGIAGLPSSDITDMALAGEEVWITTDGGGVSILNILDGSVEILQNVPGDESSLPANALFTVAASKNDVWLGTVRCGAVNVQRHYIKAFGGCAFGLSCDDDGFVWVGSDGQGLSRFDPATEEFRYYPSTGTDYIPVVSPYRKGEVLMMRYHKGMYVMDTSTGNMRPLRIDGRPAVDADWNTSYLHYCYKARPDEILIYGPLLYAYNPQDESTRYFSFADGKPADWVHIPWWGTDFFLASKGNELYSGNYDSLVLARLCDVGAAGDILCASFDKNTGRIWLSTEREVGYVEYSGHGLDFGQYHHIDNTPFQKASALTVDAHSRLWIAADMQLYLYRPELGTFSSFGPFDGYPLCDILNGWNTEVSGDVFYWAGTSGLVRINTALADAVSEKKAPVMSLSEIISDKNRYVFDGNVPRRIKMPWNHGTLTVNYKVSNLAFYDNATYVYTVSGKDESRVTSRMASLEIASLPPGDYVISATCSPSKSVSVACAPEVRIKVMQPWYKSLAFSLVLIGLIALLVVFVTYSVVERNMAKGGVVENAISDKDRAFIEKLNSMVEEKMGEEQLDSDYLTVALGVSRTALFEKVRKLTGYSLNDYVKRLRINKAAELLRETSMSIIEISEATGFAYPRYFSSVFKDLTGESPTEFRKTNSNK